MDRTAGVNEQRQIIAEYTLDSAARLRIVRQLHELIVARSKHG
jgi:hypothetical protein